MPKRKSADKARDNKEPNEEIDSDEMKKTSDNIPEEHMKIIGMTGRSIMSYSPLPNAH